MQKHVALGVDIGGTNTAFGLVRQNGEVVFESSVDTKSFETPTDLVKEIARQLDQTNELGNLFGIGIGAPNGNTFTGNIEFAPNLCWKGIIPITDLFEQEFNRPAVLENDANAAAMGEHLFGAARDLSDFVTITLGTGLGSGVFIDGQIIVGSQGFAGEFGHVRVIPNGRKCACGRLGCLETYVSSTGVVRSITELESKAKEHSILLSLENPTAKDVFKYAELNDQFAQEIIEFTAEILGSSLADFSCFSNPKAYILFGGIAQGGNAFVDKVKYYFDLNALEIFKYKVEIRVSELHDRNAAVLGTAASLFWKALKK